MHYFPQEKAPQHVENTIRYKQTVFTIMHETFVVLRISNNITELQLRDFCSTDVCFTHHTVIKCRSNHRTSQIWRLNVRKI